MARHSFGLLFPIDGRRVLLAVRKTGKTRGQSSAGCFNCGRTGHVVRGCYKVSDKNAECVAGGSFSGDGLENMTIYQKSQF